MISHQQTKSHKDSFPSELLTGIHLAVRGDAIGVHQLLETLRELVGAIVGGRRLFGLDTVQHRADGRSRSLRSTAQRQLDRFCVGRWHPALGDQAFLRYVQVEPVERVVYGLDLAHLDEPSADVFGGGDQHSVTVVLSLSQYLRTARETVGQLDHQEDAVTGCGSG